MDIRENLIDVDGLKMFFKNMIKIETWRLENYIRNGFTKLWEWIFPFLFSLIGIVTVSILFIFKTSIISENQIMSSALLAFAAMLGSFVILVSTLAMTPIQNSMTHLTPMIRQFLNKDIPSQVSFFLIALLSLLLMSLSVLPSDTISLELKFLIGLFVTFVAFDLVRLYQRSTLKLMEPTRAIDLLVKQTHRYLIRCKRGINEFIRLQVSNPESQEVRMLIANAYKNHGVDRYIEKCFSDISEVARRAVKAGDLSTCERSLNALLEVFFKYIEVRKETISLLPEVGSFGITRTTDTRPLVISLLESLRKIGNEAVSSKDENVCQALIKTHESLGCLFVSIGIKDYDNYEESSPDTSMIIGYMDKLVLSGLKAGMEDVALTAAYAIRNMAIRAKQNVRHEHFYGTAIEKLSTLCMVSYATNKGPVAGEISKSLMFLARRVIVENHFQKKYILQEIFRRYELILPLSMKNPQVFFSTMDAYSTTGDYSFLKITELSLQLYADTIEGKLKEGEVKFKIHDLECVMCEVLVHLREIASKVTFTDDMVLWSIVQYIKHAGQLLFNLRSWSLIDEQDRHTLDSLIGRFSGLTGWFFSTDKKFTLQNAMEAADVVAYLGILAVKEQIEEVYLGCFKTLSSLFEKTHLQHKNPYSRDVIIKMWILKIYADKMNNAELTLLISKFLDEPIKGIEADELVEILNGLENRKGHLEDRLNEWHGGYRIGDKAEDLLYELLNDPNTSENPE